jgi:hypothetical protein
VSKLFWPLKCASERSGLVIGWNIRDFISCVATIVPDVEVASPAADERMNE